MIPLSFQTYFTKLVNLRERPKNDSTMIVNLTSYDIFKYFYEVTYPYKLDDALNFIKLAIKIKSHKNNELSKLYLLFYFWILS